MSTSGSEVVTDSASHHTATTLITTPDAELQKILASYEELSKKLMQYVPTPTLQTVPQSPVNTQSMSQSRNVSVQCSHCFHCGEEGQRAMSGELAPVPVR